ncbi:MAG: RNA polymerase subunit sigma, partial [Planctomycetaceae bacterium]
LIALDEALERLAQKDKVKADLVKLRFFAGLTGGQAATVLGISHNTADRYWAYARSWLHLEITKATGS